MIECQRLLGTKHVVVVCPKHVVGVGPKSRLFELDVRGYNN